jgi:hypothetical protein
MFIQLYSIFIMVIIPMAVCRVPPSQIQKPQNTALSTETINKISTRQTTCKPQIYHQFDQCTQGTWWSEWYRTSQSAYSGGHARQCGAQLSPINWTGNVTMSYGELAASLALNLGDGLFKSQCMDCAAPMDSQCYRLWYQSYMNWKDCRFTKHEFYTDGTSVFNENGNKACANLGDRVIEIGRVHINWPVVDSDGLGVVQVGCSLCSD